MGTKTDMTPELLNVDPWARRDKNCKRVPAMKSGYCRPEVDLRASSFRDEIVRGLLALAAILAIGVFLIAL